MFVGHYAASLAAKRWAPEAPLWLLFLAVQLLDLLFFPLSLLGIEQLRLIDGPGAVHFELPHMPWSHSLAAAALWSVLAGAATWAVLQRRSTHAAGIASAVALCVASHWLLDLPVHMPDLALLPGEGSAKLGFGLWRWTLWSWVAEMGVVAAGLALAWRFGRDARAMPVLGAALVIAGSVNLLMPPLGGPVAMAWMGLGSYLAFAALAWWAEGPGAAAPLAAPGRPAAPQR